MTTALYGKSGIGKSTLLRVVAGLDRADSGVIHFGEDIWFSDKRKINLPIAKRRIGFVFQDFNLFPNMTVGKNLRYASESGDIPQQIIRLLNLMGLDNLSESYPDELSGGQRQRIAILRALCQAPDLLLLDEPFSALDDDAIELLIDEIKLVQSELGTTIVVVSHRKDTIFSMADHVIHLKENGESLIGTPQEVLMKPVLE